MVVNRSRDEVANNRPAIYNEGEQVIIGEKTAKEHSSWVYTKDSTVSIGCKTISIGDHHLGFRLTNWGFRFFLQLGVFWCILYQLVIAPIGGFTN